MDAGSQTNGKILDRAGLLAARRSAREAGESVVQCHGCFDIVHPGHVRHLQFASTQGERLLVSITPDEEVNKGDGRPLFSQDLRAENLAALDCVDWVYINDEPTARGLLEAFRPDVYIKGREYERNDDPRFLAERAVIEGYGGRVVFSSGDVVFSSTALVGAIGRGASGDVGLSSDPVTAAAATGQACTIFRMGICHGGSIRSAGCVWPCSARSCWIRTFIAIVPRLIRSPRSFRSGL